MHITVIGTGYVGLVAGAGLADFGMDVICVDKNASKIEMLNQGQLPFYEPGLKELVERNFQNGRLSFSTDLKAAVERSLVIFLGVGTPSDGEGGVDLSAVREVAMEIAKYLNDYKVLVTKSTVPVGTNRWLKSFIDEHKTVAVEVDVVSNPEFLREGSAVEDFMRPNRLVLGSDSPKALAIVKDIYRPLYLIETPFVETTLETAEMIKYASNAFLATKISFINEVANLCEKVGADVHAVAKAMGLDRRIGPKFLHPGPGYGGSCFPKDTLAFALMGRQHNARLHIVDAVIEVNARQRANTFLKLQNALGGSLKDQVVAILGLSFKPNTSDIREAPSIFLVKALLEQGAIVRCYDPAAMEEFKRLYSEDVVYYASNPYDAARGAVALVILTEWNEFRNLNMQEIRLVMANKERAPVVLDMRNIYDPAKMVAMGFRYDCVGRPVPRDSVA
ncbi:MAG: UDP-glucose/GDP-mannose dehydrogenase family protein [Dissulfuribacterales bacterium]